MSKPIPTVQRYMTTSPHSIGVEQTLAHAHVMLREHDIRHLPVLSSGRLVGIVTDRDLRLIESLPDVDPKELRVEDAMATNVYSVSPDTPLDEVLETMAEHNRRFHRGNRDRVTRFGRQRSLLRRRDPIFDSFVRQSVFDLGRAGADSDHLAKPFRVETRGLAVTSRAIQRQFSVRGIRR
jgi:acetoin utilization protein AcuB